MRSGQQRIFSRAGLEGQPGVGTSVKNDELPSIPGEKSQAQLRMDSPFEVVVYTKHGLMLLPRILDVNAAGETQLMFCKAQLLQSLLRRHQTEALQRRSTNPP